MKRDQRPKAKDGSAPIPASGVVRKPETGNLKPEVRAIQVSSFSSKSSASRIPVSGLRTPLSAPIQVSGFKSQVSETDAVSSAIVAYFVDAAALLGVPKSVAAIYGTCFASAEPLSFSEIQERLDLSAGSISQGLRVLREVGALRVVASQASGGSVDQLIRGAEAGPRINGSTDLLGRVRHTRVACYEPDLQLRKLAQHFLETRVRPQLASGSGRLAAILAAADAGPVRARVEHLRNWHAKAEALLPLAASFLDVPPSELLTFKVQSSTSP